MLQLAIDLHERSGNGLLWSLLGGTLPLAYAVVVAGSGGGGISGAAAIGHGRAREPLIEFGRDARRMFALKRVRVVVVVVSLGRRRRQRCARRRVPRFSKHAKRRSDVHRGTVADAEMALLSVPLNALLTHEARVLAGARKGDFGGERIENASRMCDARRDAGSGQGGSGRGDRGSGRRGCRRRLKAGCDRRRDRRRHGSGEWHRVRRGDRAL